MNENSKDWQQLEILVAQIQKELAPGAIVEHNVKLKGHATETMRQVDVLVRQNIGQYEILIAIDCKDYKTPVDVKSVEEFYGLLTDIGVHKGSLVCPKGFTNTAKKRAKSYNIDLYSPVDTDPHKWQVKLTLPLVCDFRSAAIAFGIEVSAPNPLILSNGFFEDTQVFDKNGKSLGTSLKTVFSRWNNGEYPSEPGKHEDIPIFASQDTLVDNGYGQRIPVNLHISLLVEQRLYFGYLPIEKLRGLKNEHTGLVVTNAFTTGFLDADEVENRWERLKPGEKLPVLPVVRIVGLDCYEVR
jgi:hypothetical protein